MKTQITFTILLVALFTQAFSQDLVVGTYVEKTSVSPKIGTKIAFQTRQGFEIGGFYQQEAEMLAASENKPYMHEKEFYGVSLAAPFYYSEKYAVKLNVRTGVANGENFAITPSLTADYKITKNIYLNGGIGVKAFRPTLQGGISVSLF